MNIAHYRESAQEKQREQDLLRLVPHCGGSVLDIGTRDGHYARLLTERFDKVVALDLEKPNFDHKKVETAQGNVAQLNFPDNSFDCVFCTEVLEHVAALTKACQEIARVARRFVIIGVPYDQDLRLGQTRCAYCGKRNPPWGHVNAFPDGRVEELFTGLTLRARSFVGSCKEQTNAFSDALMALAGDPWGTYEQDEPCTGCGKKLVAPIEENRTLLNRMTAALAVAVQNVQERWCSPRPIWIHALFEK